MEFPKKRINENRNTKGIKLGSFGSIKSIEIMKKNLKALMRNKNTILFLILIPVFYYMLWGFIYGGRSADSGAYIYNVGFVNLDTDQNNTYASASPPETNWRTNITALYDALNSSNSIRMINYSSNISQAEQDLKANSLDVILKIPKGFGEYINDSAHKVYALYNNDSTTADAENYTYNADFYIGNFYFDKVNISGENFDNVLAGFNASKFDYIIFIRNGFAQNLNEKKDVYIDIYFRNGTMEHDVKIQNGVINSTIQNLIFFNKSSNETSNIIIIDHIVEFASLQKGPAIEFIFRNSADSTMKKVVSSILQAIIDGYINYNPNSVSLDFKEQSILGHSPNIISIGAPGYLLYGLLSILSSLTFMITQENTEGLLKRLELSRLKGKDLLLGYFFSNTFVVIFQFLIGLGILGLFGLELFYADIVSYIIGLLITLIMLSFFLNGLALISAAIFKSPDSASGGVWIFIIPLMALSGGFFPLEYVAPSIIPYVRWLPTRIIVLLLKDIQVNAIPLLSASIWLNFAILLVENLSLYLIGIKMYKKLVKNNA
ncbi:MAG: ABC transporter permease [Promethearchaeota archaeon]